MSDADTVVYNRAAACDVLVETQERVLADALRALGASVDVMRLTPAPAGDLAFVARGQFIGGEVKEANDLLSSWVGRKTKMDGQHRLDSQLSRMVANYDRVVLFIHGWFGVSAGGYIQTARREETRLKWDGLWNTLLRWQMKGVMLDVSTSRTHVAERVLSFKKYIERKGWPDG